MSRALPLVLLLLAGCEMTSPQGTLAIIPSEFQGYWATDIYGQCPNYAMAGESEGAPVAITSDRIVGLENTCTVLQAVRGGEGILTAQLRCTGEGTTEEITATLYRSGRSLTFNRGDGSVLWSLCPVPLQSEAAAAPEAAAEQAPEDDATEVPVPAE